MADGTKEFTALEDGTYESTVQDGSLTIVTSYDADFEITGTEVQKAYENVQMFDDMPDKFKDAWEKATSYLPSSWTPDAIQFAEEGNQILVIATADDPSGDEAFANGDVIGRITSWDGTGTWTRWFDDQEFDVESSEWNYNYHLEDWTYFANSGGREVSLTNLTDADGNPIDDQIDEVGQHVSGVAHKSLMSEDDWAALQGEAGASDDMLTRLGTDWSSVNYIQAQDNSWSSVENDYRGEYDNWSGREDRIELHGFASGDTTDTVFLGAIIKRDGFILLRDANWNEVARLMDPSASSEDTSYEAMVEKFGETFSDMWPALETVLPTSLSSPEDLLYVEDQHSDILVFNATGEMVARLNHWDHSNTWERSWDDEYPSQTWSNSNFEVQVRESSEEGQGHWVSLGRYEAGQSDLTTSDGVTETEHSWERTSSTLYERNSEADDWAALEADYFPAVIADSLDDITSWDDVHRIEISENNSIFYPVAWRDQLETEESTEVRFYEEIEMDGGNWYRQKFLGSMEKRDGFIEIRNENWETVARVVDISDTSNLKDWDFITNQYQGIEDAWDNAVLFFPDVATVAGEVTTWDDNPLKDPESLLFTTDDNHIYAFTAAGAMAGQINYWVSEDEWERFYDDEIVTVKNVHFNYNFHDADWNQIANSGGNQRYIIDPENGAEVLDEVGKNIGFMQRKADVDPTLWETYDPEDDSGTITFEDVTEIRYETRSWESVTNKFRDEDDSWSDSNVQIQYYEEVDGRDWPEFTGSVEQRDGFIELRDEHWRIVSKKVDGGETFLQMVTKYGSDFTKAWEALEESLPSEWATDGAYESFKFTTDKWDNILIFDDAGEMVGQINYWSHVDQWSRSWDEEYPSQIHTNKNFHFQGMDTDEVTGNWHWVSIGEYQVGKDELVEPDGTTTVLERSWENVGQTMFARLSDGDSESGAWNTTIKDSYFTDAVADNLNGIDNWASVDRIEVSSNTYTHEAIRWRDEVEVDESVQVRFYEEVEMEGGWYHTKFLGSMEKRDGFVEIRNENWETVARIADLSGSDMLTWNELQAATDADGNLLYPEISSAWDAVKAFFPDIDMRPPSIDGSDSEYPDSEYPDSEYPDSEYPDPELEPGPDPEVELEIEPYDEPAEVTIFIVPADTLYNSDGDAIPSGTYAVDPIMGEYGEVESVDGEYMPVFQEPGLLAENTDYSVLEGLEQLGFIMVGGDFDELHNGEEPYAFVAPSASVGVEASEENDQDWAENPLKTPSDLVFTTDEEHIYAFTSSGEMVGQINFWNDENEWERFIRYDDPDNEGSEIEELKTIKNVNYNYNFHDADWNNVANSGGNARYIVDEDDDGNEVLVLDEVGSNIGFMQRINEVDPDLWGNYDPEDDSGTINWDNVVEIRYETNSWQSVSGDANPYRDGDDDWSDSSVTIQYYEQVEGQNWTQFVGSKQERDGFIEIRDEHWNVVSKKVDTDLGKSYNQMLTEAFGADLDAAWTALESNLPIELQDPSALTFTKDQWDNILIFGEAGAMIGQINYWSHTDYHDRSWDDEYPSGMHYNSNFHFQGIETQEDGNWHWVSIGHYGVGGNTLIDADGEEIDENSWVNVGSTMFERSSPDTWDTDIKTAYFVDAVAESLESVGGWSDIDRIEVSENTHTRSAEPSWRDEEEVDTSLQVRFYEEIEMDGGWYHNKFLGTMEKRDGFIEIRDENWNTISRVVDPDSATSFSEIVAQYKHLDWAWNEVAEYLPDEAADPNALSFTEDDYNIFAFDDEGNMVVQINTWSWTHEFTDSLGILRQEESYDYNFQDADWNNFASARKSQEFISDTTESGNLDKTDQLDREHTGGSFRVRKDDVSAEEWAALNPDDKTGTIIWDDVVEISIGVHSWQSFENFDRAADSTYSDSEQRVEYFELIENEWGDSWPDRVGVIETQGSLQRVYDRHWELVGSQTDGQVESVSLMSVLNDTDMELIAQFREALEQYVDLETAEFIENEEEGEPGLLVQDGQIIASVYYQEDISDGGTRLNWDYDFKDLTNTHILDLGGWNALEIEDDPDSALAKPNGVDMREYFYKDRLSEEEWAELEDEASFNFSGFDWGEVGVVSRKIYLNDYDDQGFYDTRTKYTFVKVDPMSGRQDWNYFQTEIEGDGPTRVEDGDGNLLGYAYPEGSEPGSLADEMGSDFEPLLAALNAHLDGHSFQNSNIPVFSAGEFEAIQNAVTWTQNDGVSQLSIFGDLEVSDGPNEWGDIEFRIRFEREDGNPLVEFGGWASTDQDGNADYDHAEIRIREFVYKTDLESDTLETTSEWGAAMTLYGPSDSFIAQMDEDIWDDTEPHVEIIQLESRYRYRDQELAEENPTYLSGPDEIRARFMEGTIDSTADLDIEWTYDQDFRIEFSGGVAALMEGDNQIGLELDTQTGMATPSPFVSNSDLFADAATGEKLMAAVDTLFGSKLAAEVPGYASGELQASGNNIFLVATDGSILARGDLYTDLTVNAWGNISFNVNFEGANGHNSIGFGGYSSVNGDGKMDFTDYGIELSEYFYKSVLGDDWSSIETQYGPTLDMDIPSWDEVELVQVRTRHRDISEDADAETLEPGYYSTEVRFVEGEINYDGDLDLYYDWDFDDRIVFEGGFEVHKQGDMTIGSYIPRGSTLTEVSDLATEFISGFESLVNSTGVIAEIFSPSSGYTVKIDDGDPDDADNLPNLYLYTGDGEGEELFGLIERASWADDYESTAQGYDLRSSEDGSSIGWLFQSISRDNMLDLDGNSFNGVKTEAYSINLSKENADLTLEAWKYLNDTFPIPDDFNFDFYDVSRVRVREEWLVDYADADNPAIVNEVVFLQFDLPDQNNAARIGYDVTNNKFIAFDQGEWPDPSSDTYADDMATYASRATALDEGVAADVQDKISKIMDAVISNTGLPDDFYVAPVPDANYDVSIDAIKLKAAQDDLSPDTGGYGSDPVTLVTPLLEVSGDDNTEFTMTVDGNSTHVLTVTSDISDFGTMLSAYATTEDNFVLEDLIYGLDDFVEDALVANDAFGSSVSYNALYTFDGEQVISVSMEDLEGFANWDPIVGGDNYYMGDDGMPVFGLEDVWGVVDSQNSMLTGLYAFDDDAGTAIQVAIENSEFVPIGDPIVLGDDSTNSEDLMSQMIPPLGFLPSSPEDSAGNSIFEVTVANGRYLINGEDVSELQLPYGGVVFDTSDPSNQGHPFNFSEVPDGSHGGDTSGGYFTNVFGGGYLGEDGSYIAIDIGPDTPNLFVFCSSHEGMGFAIDADEYTDPGYAGHDSEYSDSEYSDSEYPGSEYSDSEYSDSEYPGSEYPDSEYSDSEYPDSEYPDSEYSDSEYSDFEHMDEGSPSPQDTFIMVEGSGDDDGLVYLYTPDDQISMTLTGVGDIVAGLMADPDSGATDEEIAFEMAIESVVMDFMIEDHDPYDEIV